MNHKRNFKLAIISWGLAPIKYRFYSCLVWWIHFLITSRKKWQNLKKHNISVKCESISNVSVFIIQMPISILKKKNGTLLLCRSHLFLPYCVLNRHQLYPHQWRQCILDALSVILSTVEMLPNSALETEELAHSMWISPSLLQAIRKRVNKSPAEL